MLMLSAWPLYELYMIILKQCFYTRCWRKIRIVLFLIWVKGSFREAENKKWFLDYDIVPCNSTNRNSMGDLHNMKTKMAELKTPEKKCKKDILHRRNELLSVHKLNSFTACKIYSRCETNTFLSNNEFSTYVNKYLSSKSRLN